MPGAWARRVGVALTGIFALFMALDVGIKLLGLPVVDETLATLGWPAGAGWWIGLLQLGLLALYLGPRTAVLGAVLMTGLLGGAVATHLRVGSPVATHVLFGVYLGLLAWGGLWLRDARLRSVLIHWA
ncbi:DoxX family protein [Roseomonas sp. CCTCC AB2023176]|uniref:DoxX family protein n=1 Tax=Roseomonas sp. CCTCC AB2023176 TaxID=3342640 RepID=UPI0035E1D6CA